MLAMSEQVESLNGQIAMEKEGRLLDSDAHSRFVAVETENSRDS